MQQYVVYKKKKRQGPAPSLTPGKQYPVLEEREKRDGQMVLVENDRGAKKWYYRDAFEEETAGSAPSEQSTSNEYKDGYRDGFNAGVKFQMDREKNPLDGEAMEIIRKAAGIQKKVEEEPLSAITTLILRHLNREQMEFLCSDLQVRLGK